MPPIKPSPELRLSVLEKRSHKQLLKDWRESHAKVIAKATVILNEASTNDYLKETPWLDDPNQSNATETVSYKLRREPKDEFQLIEDSKMMLHLRLRPSDDKKNDGRIEKVATFTIDEQAAGVDLNYGGWQEIGPFEAPGIYVPGSHKHVLNPDNDERFTDIKDTLNLMGRVAIMEELTTRADLVQNGAFTPEELELNSTEERVARATKSGYSQGIDTADVAA